MIIFICDGSSKGNPGESRIGVVMWKRLFTNQKTTPDKTLSEPIGIATNNDAEWRAILRALELAQEYKNQPIFIYSDSMVATMQASGKWRVKDNRMREYKHRFDELSRGFMDITISWLPRQLTVLADRQT